MQKIKTREKKLCKHVFRGGRDRKVWSVDDDYDEENVRADEREQGRRSNRGSRAILQMRFPRGGEAEREIFYGSVLSYTNKTFQKSRSNMIEWLTTHLSAIRYFGPSFSNSAMTQSVIVGIPVQSERDQHDHPQPA